jgi:hypothetical protein
VTDGRRYTCTSVYYVLAAVACGHTTTTGIEEQLDTLSRFCTYVRARASYCSEKDPRFGSCCNKPPLRLFLGRRERSAIISSYVMLCYATRFREARAFGTASCLYYIFLVFPHREADLIDSYDSPSLLIGGAAAAILSAGLTFSPAPGVGKQQTTHLRAQLATRKMVS